ncbi:MAG: hypothetical protein HOV77_05580 [Hamadaea sp.]|uniref:hypothetical protein n=1 Tax=Hamadaea sp. TaxID=2024425 RepID=UPI001837CD58|nr:hypothetical protein [Hamadaea sp.]NUT18635.1 hypothetical protein [Hamadaea sp.]
MVSAILAAGLAAPAVAAPDSHGIAAAGTQCYPNTKTFKRGTTQRTVTINLCVQRIGSSTLRAYADISMGKKSGTPDIVYDATLNVRLEHNDDPIESTADSMGYEINDESASAWGWIVSTDEFSSTVVGGWSADGVVYYDLVGDGLGTQAWELHGSPTI